MDRMKGANVVGLRDNYLELFIIVPDGEIGPVVDCMSSGCTGEPLMPLIDATRRSLG